MSAKSKQKAQALDAESPKGNSTADSPVLPCKKGKPAKLRVKVYCTDGGGKQYVAALVKANALSKNSAPKTGLADFATVPPDTYTISVENVVSPDDKVFVHTDDTKGVTLGEGDDRTIEIPVERKNIVTPKIELEYKVVLLERKLAAHQDGAEPEKFYADATYLELSFTEKYAGLTDQDYGGGHHFEQGGVFTCSPANVDIYLDEKCEDANKLAADGQLSKDQLAAGKKLKLYLKGKTAGKFTAKLTLNDPADRFIELDKNPAEEEMGVVELKLIPHQHDTSALASIKVDPDTDPVDTYHTNLLNKALPDQKELTDEQKVKIGRFLHVQDAGHFDRAKLLAKQLEAAQWPGGTDDYDIVLTATDTSGGLALHGKEWDDDLNALPLKIKVSDLKAADKEYWLQGASACAAARGVRLDLGLDRADGGLAKTPKRNGDWARFTAVKIDEVKLDYTPPTGGKPNAWDSANNRFRINLKTDPDGRKIKLTAKLSAALKDVTIHFMLAPDKDNTKAANWGVGLPATWKWKNIAAAVKHLDKADRKNLMHLSAKTDANGVAKIEVKLSRFGGDKFQPAAYIDQDPHLAKYVHGHADLEKKKPIFAAHTITVWRKFWYRVVKVEGINPPGVGVAEGQYTRVKATMRAGPELPVTRATVDGFNPKAIYPMYMVRLNGGNGDALVVSDANKAQFFTGYLAAASRPIEVPILVCDAQWDAGGSSTALNSPALTTAQFPVDLVTDKLVLTPPLQGGDLFVSGTWRAAEWDATAVPPAWVNARNGALTNANLSVNAARGDLHAVTVALPAGVGAATADTRVWLENLVVKGANGPYLGESFNRRILAVYEPLTPLQIADFQNTIVHELGHAFHQVIEGNPAGGIAGIPKHPKQKDVGQGNHCRNLTNKCVMYDSGPIAGSLNRYCDMCHPYLLVQDMDSIK